MTELYFLRHGSRIDHNADSTPLIPQYKPYDPSLSTAAIAQLEAAANQIIDLSPNLTNGEKKSVFIHFLPYLRCVQSADLLLTNLKQILATKFPDAPKLRFQLLGDFALSEWIHDKMQNKPPYFDSNDAYEMYTHNLAHVANKSNLSNFRPTVTLGPWNGHDLSFKNYQSRSKDYFKKLLATYDKPNHIKNNDVIVVISHGYMINNFLSFFINHPIFDEIPEAKVNFAERQETWKLIKDALNFTESEHLDASLNLDTDIVYYKTNFIKKSELNGDNPSDKPRDSFKIKLSISQPDLTKLQKPIFPSTKNWTPQTANKYRIKTEFKLKVMNDEAFKKSFDLSHHPEKPITPEISPNSDPSRDNSVVDFSKLSSNEDIYKPMKLKYSSTGDIPIETLNSKINSQLNMTTLNAGNASASSLFKLNSRGSLTNVNGDSITSPISAHSPPPPISSQINLSQYLRSQPNSTHNLEHTVPTISETPDPVKAIALSFKEPKSKASSNESIALQEASIKFVGSLPTTKPVTVAVKPKKQMVFNFVGSDSDEEEEESDKKYMWFGGNL